MWRRFMGLSGSTEIETFQTFSIARRRRLTIMNWSCGKISGLRVILVEMSTRESRSRKSEHDEVLRGTLQSHYEPLGYCIVKRPTFLVLGLLFETSKFEQSAL
jgi:hypothetical protein